MKQVNKLLVKEWVAIASQKAKEYERPIKIVGIEYLFDIKKVNIYYKTGKENKMPDLKDYRKDLSSELKAEITMRAVTPRDEARFIGGLGPCGKSLCCTSWLQKPKHITVKMVKDQGFQISPTKTSGICGRLMCCFEYEQEKKKEVEPNYAKD
jgi:cell fate regulator YaaT (PSP1 superfamily)